MAIATRTLAGLTSMLLVIGCAGPSTTGPPQRSAAGPRPGLVLYGAAATTPAWETSRNDPTLSVNPGNAQIDVEALEVRSIDRMWTSNGRVRESSRTTVKTLKRHLRVR